MIGQQGQGSGQHPDPADRHPALPLRHKTAPAASARATATSASRSAGAPASRATARARPASEPGGHILEVDVSLEELAAILGEELELPRIEPKGKTQASSAHKRPLHRHPPRRPRVAAPLQAHLHARPCSGRSPSGTYDPSEPAHRARSATTSATARWKTQPQPAANAVIIYMMDVSGSMTDEQKEIVRIEAFWIDTWLQQPVQGRSRRRYIIHDAVAREVDRDTFYHTRESGGTLISSAYKLCARDHRRRDYPPDRVEHLPASTSPTATTGARTTRRTASSCCSDEAAAAGEPVLLRPGGKPLRLAASSSRTSREHVRRATSNVVARRDRGQGRDLRLDQGVPGQGQVTLRMSESSAARMTAAAAADLPPTCEPGRDRGLRPRLRPRLLPDDLRGARRPTS